MRRGHNRTYWDALTIGKPSKSVKQQIFFRSAQAYAFARFVVRLVLQM
jgi:hypothetical protein